MAEGDREIFSRAALLNTISSRIRRSLELQDILDTTVAEVSKFLDTDRVKIYRFDPDGHGQVIAESVRNKSLPILKGLYFPASDIPPQARELFCRARVRTIVDIAAQEIILSSPKHGPSTSSEDLSVEEVCETPLDDLLVRPVDPCHVEYLSLMGVQSSVVVPLLDRRKLWGLLISHHHKPKAFESQVLQILQLIADQVEIAIAQANMLNSARARADTEATLNHLTSLLHSPEPQPLILEKALGAIVEAVDGVGGELQITSMDGRTDSYACGTLPDIEQENWIEFVKKTPRSSAIFASSDIQLEANLAPFVPSFLSKQIRGLALTSLSCGGETIGNLAVFRQEIDTERLWAGRNSQDDRQDRPRQSFEAWQELKQYQAYEWKASDIGLLEKLNERLSMAVMQERLYRCEHEQRLLLELRNQELSSARSSAEEASRLKSDFLSSTSHELRTPLALTLNYLKLMKEGFYDNEEELEEYIGAAYQSTEDLVSLINTVLDISKIEADRMPVTIAPVNLPKVIESKLAIFKPDSERRNVKLTASCKVNTVLADELKLRQVLNNLLSNAFKFTSEGSIEVIATETVDGVATISVRDTGIGVEQDKQDLVFEAFVQEEGTIRRQFGGTGLGLTICKKFVELMEGTISLESPGKGKGTTVSFTLPCVSR